MATGENVGRLGPTSNLSAATVLSPGGGTARTLAEWMGDVVNVKAFGAVLDGVTDDSAAFTAAAAKGRPIYLPGSAIKLTSTVDAQGQRVVGASTAITGIIRNHAGIYDATIKGHQQSQPVIFPRPVTRRDFPIIVYSQSESAPPSQKNRQVFVSKVNAVGTQKYVRMDMGYNLFTTTISEGGQSELWRLTTVTDIGIGYVWLVGTPTLSGASWTTGTTATTLLGASGNGGLPYWRTTANGDYLEWSGVTTGSTLGVGTWTSASGALAEVLVDGVVVSSFTTDAASGGLIRWIKIPVPSGTHTVRIRHAGAGGENLYVFGVNFFEFRDADPAVAVDTMRYGYDGTAYPAYVTSSGANEYAVYSVVGGKWSGNYHGGETANSAAVWRLDGVDTSFTAGDIKIARSVTIDQDTHIAWAAAPSEGLDLISRHDFHDSGVSFRCAMAGTVTASSFYTHMATTSPTFTRVLFPRDIDTTDTNDPTYDAATGYHLLGRTNQIIQQHPGTGRLAQSWWTLHPYEVTRLGGAAVLPNASYRKVYYGLCEGANRAVTSAAWESVWLFN